MSELMGNDIKEAVASRLMDIYPNVTVYQEAMNTSPVFPHFFVRQIGIADEEERSGVHLLSYDMEVRYREASDYTTVKSLAQKLDKVSLRLLANFNIIDFDDDKIKAYNKRVEKVDGVLYFFCSFDVMARAVAENGSADAKQGKLTLEVDVNGR